MAKPSYNGPFLLLHLNEADGFLDKSPARRQIATNGDIIRNPFDGPFADPDGFPTGCAEWPESPTPGGTLAGNFITVGCQELLSWQDEHFTIEFWTKIPELPDDSYRLEITNMGNTAYNRPMWTLYLRKVYNQDAYELNFEWIDVNGINKGQSFPFTGSYLRIQEWEHFVFTYSPLSQSFDYWINGESKGPFLGVSRPGDGPWSGVNILQSNNAGNVLTIGGVYPGDRTSNNNDATPDTYKGLMAEYRLMSAQSVYPLGEDFTPRTTTYPDYEFEGGDSEIVEINPSFVNGLPKIYFDSSRHCPKLAKTYFEDPATRDDVGFNEGELYFQRPDPQQPEIFLWVYVNINAENEAPVFRWVPVSAVQKGLINPETGNPWRSRRGNRLGEPF